MCSSLEVPHVEVRLVPQRDEQQLFSVNVYPDASYLVAAYLDVLRYYNWKKFCVVYGDEADLLLLQAIIRAPLGNGVHVIVRQVRRGNMRETLKEIEKRGVRRIVAHLNIDKTQMFLKAALQLGMIDPSHHYLFTNLVRRHNRRNLSCQLTILNTAVGCSWFSPLRSD
ncbi:hypothetical protein NP493_103g03008 [Ridgeia piscesae]|uniref:Receptor ligand binding region domain-containing protein n=1 Tax=Ridgeia piscesae TaxID=27915 RepID=A0AAD9P7F7_RIDPI|nr:hypothetical protein NP493_103g03008 [Ridgeia piscesae]